jgi:hypothetical protein
MILHNLPYDIILHIIPFTYSVQKKKLLEDIQNFHDTKNKIKNIYRMHWMTITHDTMDPDIEADDWLINDVFSYANNYVASMNGYTKSFYNIFRRIPRLKKTRAINKYVSALEKNNSKTQFNVVWGLMRQDERDEFCREITFSEEYL